MNLDAPTSQTFHADPLTVPPKVARSVLGGRLTASQIENLVRSGCTQASSAGRGIARAFTRVQLFELALGGELLALGYAGPRLRLLHKFILLTSAWKKLCDPTQRERAAGLLAMYPGQATTATLPIHLPVFHRNCDELWLSGEAPSATVIAVAAMMTTIEARLEDLDEALVDRSKKTVR